MRARSSKARRQAGESASNVSPFPPVASSRSQQLLRALFAPVDAASLAVFRMAFGALLFWEVWRYLTSGWIQAVYIDPPFHFTYAGFGWVRPLPGDGMFLHFLALAALAACVAIGLWFRVACVLLSLGWTYVLLIEKTEYLNHQYLICLVALLLAFSGADREWSFAAQRRRASQPGVVPAWCLWLLRFQIALPYVFGGIAKLNGDWLHGLPMRIWMSRMDHLREVPFFSEPWAGVAMSYGGLLLDLLVVPLLLWKPTRPWAFAAAVGFHLFNAVMFRIGVFPWLMIVATTLFFSPSWPRRFLPASRNDVPAATSELVPRQRRLVVSLLAVWVAVQLLVPFRHFLYPGDVAWTEEGARFSWRMMLTDKAAALRITASDPETGQTFLIDPRLYLSSPKQIERMTQYPDMLHEFCRHVSADLAAHGHPHAVVNVLNLVSLNGREPQPLVDPQVDLGREPMRLFEHHPWVQPLTESRRESLWIPPPEWQGSRDAASPAE